MGIASAGQIFAAVLKAIAAGVIGDGVAEMCIRDSYAADLHPDSCRYRLPHAEARELNRNIVYLAGAVFNQRVMW